MENIPSNYKFLFYKTKAGFERDLSQQKVRDASIVFIQGEAQNDRAIWTHHTYFSVSDGLEHSKGVFETLGELQRNVRWPVAGDWAIVLNPNTFPIQFPLQFGYEDGQNIYVCQTNGVWTKTERRYDREQINLTNYIKKDEINFGEYWRKDELNLSPYLTREDASSLYARVSTTNGLSNRIDNIEDQIANFVGRSELNSYATRSQLSEYLKIADISKYIQSTSTGIVDLSNFYTRQEVDSLIQTGQQSTPADLSEIEAEISALRDTINNLNTQVDCNCPAHVFLTQSQYDALEEYDANTLYFITAGWMFGGQFPITLT